MVQEPSISEQNFVFLVQTKNRNLERLISESVDEENIRFVSVGRSEDLKEQQPDGQIITFIIGSDIEDPIRSAQRLHAINKSAKIILLSKSEENAGILKEAIKFSPFIGTDVFCLDQSKEAELETRLKKILQDSLKAEKYRAVIAESNSQISSSVTSQKPAFNQNFINRLMDVAPIGIAIVGRQINVLGWNKKAASIFNKNEVQILGTSLSQLFEPAEGNKLEDYLSESFEKGESGPVDSLLLEREAQDTSKQVLSITAAPFTYSGGTQKVLILAIKDITQNVELLNQLKTEVTARDNFLSMASHELKTPLTTMKINLELLGAAIKQDLSGTSGSLELNDKSLEQAERLNDLIEDLFDVAKIHSGMLDFQLEKFDLSEFVKSYVMEMEQKFKAADCPLELDIEPDVIGVWDKDRIGQAFANLITNALKYASGSPVNIVLKTTGNRACLSVIDQGPGISEDKQEKIFDRFERASPSKTISGLGLGLFITKKIVEGHAGEIDFQSTPGEGSAFTLKLPLNLDPDKQSEGLGVHW